jgi:hypothetical protein
LIELDVPRNLRCSTCDGGGCDLCDRSGAVTLRGRDEPPEIIQVTLPRRTQKSGGTGVTIRIPEQGGLPRSSAEPVRGFLLLTVVTAPEADPSVRLLESPIPASVELGSSPVAKDAIEPAQPESGVRVRRRRAVVPVAVALIALWLAFLLYLRLSGRG